ncbi:hypothetical protein HNR02_005845 [Amycolatopsis endophytica]|uniref:Uncharacterized protein n=1 Tax=Amycolatopsis endophytica TaxID=860233 RepID=A0A853BBS4_9PSEU|nr:hypothetical protein [Amycolatopsis endophytica]NYI92470.1 hypothetical protein [Amycolatopsis endophytica]
MTSTTRAVLVRSRLALLVTTVAVLATSFATVRGVQVTAETVRDRTVQAVIEVAAAKSALIRADRAAVRSFSSGEVRLAGAGTEYATQTALASQSLTRVAELNESGESGSQLLRLVEGLLAAYRAAIAQADAHYRQGGGEVVGTADLWDASSQLLHSPDGVLDQLDELRSVQEQALARQLDTGWLHPATPALWAVPLALLLALLCVTQLYLGKRFQRLVNPQLAAATLLLLGLCASMMFTLVAAHRLETARERLTTVLAGWDRRMAFTDTDGQDKLIRLVTAHCRGDCGPTVGAAGPAPTSVPGTIPDEATTAAGTREVNERLQAAAASTDLPLVVPSVTLAIALLAGWGLHRRLDEYRFRP